MRVNFMDASLSKSIGPEMLSYSGSIECITAAIDGKSCELTFTYKLDTYELLRNPSLQNVWQIDITLQ